MEGEDVKEIEVIVGERGKQKRKGDTERDSGESERERKESKRQLGVPAYALFRLFYGILFAYSA